MQNQITPAKAESAPAEVRDGYLKHAWIRNSNVPAGQPAKGKISCPCGQAPESDYSPENGDVTCGCGTIFTWNGWIKSTGLYMEDF